MAQEVVNLSDALVDEDKQTIRDMVEAPVLAYTVNTIEDMLSVDSNKHTTVIVDQKIDTRSGTFIYDASQSAINDGGIIFNGWIRQYEGALNPIWFGAKPFVNTFDNAIILQGIINKHDELDLCGYSYYSTTISTAGKTIKNGGLLSFNGTTTLLTFDASGTKLIDLYMSGWKLNDETLASNTCIDANSDGFSISRCTISNFSYFGINITATGTSERPSYITDCAIFLNGSGINTGDGEYINIRGNKIYRNGWSNARTDRSPIFVGTDNGWGIVGKFSNTSIVNNHILENVIGCALEATGGSNPDHNMLSNNTINHNGVVGLILNGFKNNEQVVGNIVLSNIIKPYAAGTVWSPIASACDVALIDCVNMQFTNNTLGGGTLGQVPVFGHASCVYTNNIMYAPFVELRVPQVGKPIVDSYDYTVNSNNIFKNNIYRGFTQHTFLPTTVNVKSSDNIENGSVVDGIIKSPTLASGWIFPISAGDADTKPLEYWRDGGNKVTISGAVVLDGGGAIALTLPSKYRPAGDISIPCVSNDGTIQYVKIYKSGNVQPIGATSGLPFNINVTYRI